MRTDGYMDDAADAVGDAVEVMSRPLKWFLDQTLGRFFRETGLDGNRKRHKKEAQPTPQAA